MDFIEEEIDNGAPEYCVTGLASIERISAGQARVAFFTKRKEGNFITHYEVWDWQTFKRSVALYEEAARLLDRATELKPQGHPRLLAATPH